MLPHNPGQNHTFSFETGLWSDVTLSYVANLTVTITVGVYVQCKVTYTERLTERFHRKIDATSD